MCDKDVVLVIVRVGFNVPEEVTEVVDDLDSVGERDTELDSDEE